MAFYKPIAKGNADFEIDIPQFSGDMRIMASAYKDKAFAAKSSNMKVADPLVISAGIPRFLSPKDTLDMSVTLTNTTAKADNSKTTLSLSGPLSVVGASSSSTQLAANSEGATSYQIVAKPEIGQG